MEVEGPLLYIYILAEYKLICELANKQHPLLFLASEVSNMVVFVSKLLPKFLRFCFPVYLSIWIQMGGGWTEFVPGCEKVMHYA